MDHDSRDWQRHLATASIVLDWNGTTVDDATRTRTALNAAQARFGRSALDPTAYSAHFKLPMTAMMAGLGLSDTEIAPAIRAWHEEIALRPAGLARGAATLIRGMRERGRPVGVLSAAAAEVVEAEAARLGIMADLAFLIGDADPKADPLRQLVAAAAGPVLYVGDTEYDMQEALAAGAVPIGFAGGYRPSPLLLAAGAVAIVDDLALLLGSPAGAR